MKPFLLFLSLFFVAFAQSQQKASISAAFVNGYWFNGKAFEARTVYCADGLFTSAKPKKIDTTIDLQGLYCLPPFAEAHNHNIGTGVEEWDHKAVKSYLAAGVFYVKIQGNLPVSDSTKNKLGLNLRAGLDVSFAQANITATGGHPSFLVNEVLLPRGYFPGFNKESLKDFRYFTLDNEADIEKKWASIIRLKPDFIKVILSYSNEYEKRKDDTTRGLSKGLNPSLLPILVKRSHAAGLRISAHISTVADFVTASAAGVDEIVHLPAVDTIPISPEMAKQIALKDIVVITTCTVAQSLPPYILPKARLPQVITMYKESIKHLMEAGVKLVIGSDDVKGTSVEEALYLQSMSVVDNSTLLRQWTETTPQTIFPKRRLGLVKDGYEASFLVLEGNPIEDFTNIRKIKLRFKQGNFLID